ncbi:MAG: formate-nitrite transporter, partial [Enterococcus hulanensis]
MKSDLFMEIEETPATESEKHVKTHSTMMSQLEYSISKKI